MSSKEHEALAVIRISPPLDATGNSARAMKAIEEISNTLAANPLMSQPH